MEAGEGEMGGVAVQLSLAMLCCGCLIKARASPHPDQVSGALMLLFSGAWRLKTRPATPRTCDKHIIEEADILGSVGYDQNLGVLWQQGPEVGRGCHIS